MKPGIFDNDIDDSYYESMAGQYVEQEFNAVEVVQKFKGTLPTRVFSENEEAVEIVEGRELQSVINDTLLFLKDFIEGRKIQKYKANQLYRRLDRFELVDETYEPIFETR